MWPPVDGEGGVWLPVGGEGGVWPLLEMKEERGRPLAVKEDRLGRLIESRCGVGDQAGNEAELAWSPVGEMDRRQ